MTYEEIKTMIESVGPPVAYYQFEERSGQQPPFITYYYGRSNDMMADDINYVPIRPLVIELYTERKDFALEATTEGVLTANGLAYVKEETRIDSERMYMVTYNTEVLINE